MKSSNPIDPSGQRLLSLDFFRGVTMFLLVAEGTGLWWALIQEPVAGSFWEPIFQQFHHHPWHGLRFWDLIQPFFMFIVGVAMPFSYAKRQSRGNSRSKITRHILQRCLLLLAFGVGLHIGYSKKLVWELWNVLSQLSVTILIAYFLMRFPLKIQLIVSFALLLLTDLVYRYFPVDGFNQPFVIDKNFGSWMDLVLMGKLNNGGGWVAINCIPTAVHTIWGVMVGQWLMSTKTAETKLKMLVVAGIIALLIGYGLDWIGITPIIKRIATSSFVFASAGWALLVLAISYWTIDMKKMTGSVFPFVIVGMNPIFIYLFSQTLGDQWFNGMVEVYTNGLMTVLGAGKFLTMVVGSLVVLALEWGLCYWLYKRKIFFRI